MLSRALLVAVNDAMLGIVMWYCHMLLGRQAVHDHVA